MTSRAPVTHDDAAAIKEAEAAEEAASAPVPPVSLPDLVDAAAILALDDLKSEWVAVPEWGFRAMVWALTGDERDSFEEIFLKRKQQATQLAKAQGKKHTQAESVRGFRAMLVAQSVRNPSNTKQRVFSDDQVTALGGKNAAALQRIFEVAARLSGLGNDDVDELTATLGEDQSAGSGSD